VAATVSVLVLGIERLVLASVLVAMGAGLVTARQSLVPADTAVKPHWALTTGFVLSTISACVMIVATVSFVLRGIDRAEDAMETERKSFTTADAVELPDYSRSSARRA